MSHLSDQQYINGLSNGNMGILKSFIDQYKHMVYTLALRILKNHEDAEEVAQDTFMKAFQSISRFHGDSRLSTWLYKIAYHNSLDYLKRNRRNPKAMDLEADYSGKCSTDGGPWELLEATERREIINKALAKLPGEDGVILSLFYFESYSLKEISSVVGLSMGAVKVRLHRSRKRLALVLEKMWDKHTISIYANR